jgi:phage tail-like protein
VTAARGPDAPFSGQFIFTVDGVEIGAFQEVSGLAVEVEVEELQEGGQNEFVHKLPGRMKHQDLVLKRGVTDSNALFEWFAQTSGDGFAAAGDRLERLTGEIVLVNAARNPVRRWEFAGAFPVKWTGPTLATTSADVATEELEITHHGFRAAT